MPNPKPPRGPQLDLAGDLSVAFVNTACARKKNRQQGVRSYGDLLKWGQQAGLVSTPEAERMGRRAAEAPEAAEAVYARAAAVRSALMRIFVAVANETEMAAEDLSVMNAALAGAMSALRLVPGEKGLTRGWAGDDAALERMLWPVLYSASELLVSLEGRRLVRQCAGKECWLFFVDRTPSGRRVWCDSKVCGSRDKALRYYHRRGKHSRAQYWSY